MIKAETYYTVICDNCGVDCNSGQEVTAWGSVSQAVDIASQSNWKGEEDTHYCPDCVWFDDNGNLRLHKVYQ